MTAVVIGTGLAFAGRLAPTDLALDGGRLTCLIGPNGSGKTSLLHALAGIGRPLGSVRIAGADPARLAAAQRAALLSFLPASRDIAWPLVARDLLVLGLPAGSDDRLEELLGLFELHEVADRRVDRLSTGERSRLLIARALAADARLLLFDEPTANLDPRWQLRLMDHLRELARDADRAILVAVHDLDIARRYADRLLIVDKGCVAADGAPGPLLAGGAIADIFGIEAGEGGWREVRLPADPRSSP